MLSITKNLITAIGVLLMSIGGAGVANAQGASIAQLPMGGSIDMTMPLYKSRIVTVEQPSGRVAVGNPDIADIVVISPTQMYVLAKDIGNTNLLFWSRDGRLLGTIELEVIHDLDGLKAKLHQLLPVRKLLSVSLLRCSRYLWLQPWLLPWMRHKTCPLPSSRLQRWLRLFLFLIQ
jgi:Flp pilus assembly secretin CpaC